MSLFMGEWVQYIASLLLAGSLKRDIKKGGTFFPPTGSSVAYDDN